MSKNKTTSLVFLNYGFLAALTYSFLSQSAESPIFYLPVVSGGAFLFVSFFSKWHEVFAELFSIRIFRPLMFTLGQLLVVTALSFGSPLAVFISSAVGTLITVVFGRILLKEKINFFGFFGMGLVLFSVYFLKSDLSLPLLAVVAGVIQGCGMIFSRKRALQGARPFDMAAASLL